VNSFYISKTKSDPSHQQYAGGQFNAFRRILDEKYIKIYISEDEKIIMLSALQLHEV
jgi:hypothetical protein